MDKPKICRIHAFLVSNIVLGMLVFAVSVYFIIVGEYANLQERTATEAILNLVSLSSLAWGAIALIAALLAKPVLCATRQE